MRISDWSSDVCSSDLRWVAVLDALAFSPVRDKVIPTSLPVELPDDDPEKKKGGDDPIRPAATKIAASACDRKRVVQGKSVSVRVGPGRRRILKNNNYFYSSHSTTSLTTLHTTT